MAEEELGGEEIYNRVFLFCCENNPSAGCICDKDITPESIVGFLKTIPVIERSYCALGPLKQRLTDCGYEISECDMWNLVEASLGYALAERPSKCPRANSGSESASQASGIRPWWLYALGGAAALYAISSLFKRTGTSRAR